MAVFFHNLLPDPDDGVILLGGLDSSLGNVSHRICDSHLLINDDRSIIPLILVAVYNLHPVWHLLAIIINPSNDKHYCPFSREGLNRVPYSDLTPSTSLVKCNML